MGQYTDLNPIHLSVLNDEAYRASSKQKSVLCMYCFYSETWKSFRSTPRLGTGLMPIMNIVDLAPL